MLPSVEGCASTSTKCTHNETISWNLIDKDTYIDTYVCTWSKTLELVST